MRQQVLFRAFVLGLIMVVLESVSFAAPIKIKVGAYDFEPFVEGNLGLTPAFLTILNSYQNEYIFEFVPIPARRRYEIMERGNIDAIFFEMPVWGWTERQAAIEITPPILKGQELFVARKDNPRGDGVFALSQERKVALVHGYHYGFANFHDDHDTINRYVDGTFLQQQKQIMQYVLKGAADIGMMSNIFLQWEIKKQPELGALIKVAREADHEYKLPMIVRRGGPISAESLTHILTKMARGGTLKPFFDVFGIGDLVIFDPDNHPGINHSENQGGTKEITNIAH